MTMTTIGLRKKQHECVYKYERYECVYNTNVANCYGQDAVQMGYGRLTAKQTAQLIRLCNEFQPCLSFDEIVFMELVWAARICCDRGMCGFYNDKKDRFERLLIGEEVQRIKSKYYFCGFKPGNMRLNTEQLAVLNRYVARVKIPSLGFNDMRTYRPIEKVLFIKIVRACRDYMRAKMSKEAEAAFFEKLSIVYDAMKWQGNA